MRTTAPFPTLFRFSAVWHNSPGGSVGGSVGSRGTLRHALVTVASLSVILFASSSYAADVSDGPSDERANGFTFLSDAPNVTHWGLGGGVGYRTSPYAGYGANVTPLPVIYFDDKWIHSFANALDVKVANYDGVSFALRAKYALGEGYKGSDAPILNGMQTRNGAFWYGPALSWHNPIGELSASYLTSTNKGQRASIEFSHAFEVGIVNIVPHVGATWDSSNTQIIITASRLRRRRLDELLTPVALLTRKPLAHECPIG